MPRPPARQSGFTLLEVTFAAAILSLAVVALTQAMLAGQQQSHAAMRQGRSVTLAEAMIEEALSKPYEGMGAANPLGPDAPDSGRLDFDSIDDYHGFALPAGEITTLPGVRYPETFQEFAGSISVVYETRAIAELGDERQGLTVAVSVTDPQGPDVKLMRFVPKPSGNRR